LPRLRGDDRRLGEMLDELEIHQESMSIEPLGEIRPVPRN
jgi:hypothetical protein